MMSEELSQGATERRQELQGEVLSLTTPTEWHKAFLCMQALRQNLGVDQFLEQREQLLASGYHLLGICDRGAIVCVASYLLHPHIERGVEFWVHDLATLPEERGKGFGERMMRHLEGVAREKGCSRLRVHSSNVRERAHQFYTEKLGYRRCATVFEKRLSE